MKYQMRVNVGDVMLDGDHVPGDFLVHVDDMYHNKYGHSDGEVLVLRPDGSVEYAKISGDTDVDPYGAYSPHNTWSTFEYFQDTVLDSDASSNKKLYEAFIKFGYIALELQNGTA